MKEIRIHGRGGQGAVTLAELVALAAIDGGKYAQSMPSFGPERRGAPVLAFLRINDEHIKVRAEISEPDVVVVLDPGLLHIIDVTSGLKEGGTVLINTKRSEDEIRSDFGIKSRLGLVNATEIAREVLGVPITNTTMIGALLKATEIVKKDSLVEPLKHRFGPIAEKNIKAMETAYDQTLIKEA
ncbi:MAG: pyruvate ferredoxin oxidoreductase subunit gamma [Halobacteriota archaeon]|nr:pyruvate ferredoxin oxidoreductase subunit gamma [Halobacteriota archaeon]